MIEIGQRYLVTGILPFCIQVPAKSGDGLIERQKTLGMGRIVEFSRPTASFENNMYQNHLYATILNFPWWQKVIYALTTLGGTYKLLVNPDDCYLEKNLVRLPTEV